MSSTGHAPCRNARRVNFRYQAVASRCEWRTAFPKIKHSDPSGVVGSPRGPSKPIGHEGRHARRASRGAWHLSHVSVSVTASQSTVASLTNIARPSFRTRHYRHFNPRGERAEPLFWRARRCLSNRHPELRAPACRSSAANLPAIARPMPSRAQSSSLDRLACGDDAKPGVVARQLLDEPLYAWVLDALIPVLERFQPIQDQERFLPAHEIGQLLTLGPGRPEP
jgi:hypothetical protein